MKVSRLDEAWKPPFFPSHIHKTCIQLLRFGGIMFPAGDGLEIVPKLLPVHKPDLQLIWLRDDASRTQFERAWKFSYIPSGLFDALIASL